MRAALLHGPEDLRVEEVPAPDGEVTVRILAATTCGTDVKMWRRGHPALDAYPCAFGHETAGVRQDTGQPVLVAPSVACGACGPCRDGRPQICRAPTWVLGGFAEAIAAPEAALHPIPDGLEPAAAAMAEPLAAAVHAVSRGTDAREVGVLGGGPMGLMLGALLVAEGRRVTLADHHPERRAQAEALGARGVEVLGRFPLVFEAVGRPAAWTAAVEAAQPGATVVLVGGCPAGSEVGLPAEPLHYDELELRGAFHHSPSEVERALGLLDEGRIDWRSLSGPTVGLEGLPGALAQASDGPARKFVVDPGLPPG
ncbi:MAG TPA: alcohol dehydrogenase catalytic domain-containing protein [Solirubrobacteraceae bacterium]|nr:alcohol dehydrogenase catalytic domain-containing protein [Solirubrobacteraceae bacterium]